MPDKTFVGVDVGGTMIKLALGNERGEISAERSVPTSSQEGPDGVIDLIGTEALALIEEGGARPEAMGIGVPGTVDLDKGETVFLANLHGDWANVPICARLAERLGCPVYLLNDARAATLGELDFGRGEGVGTMILLTLGTGIGGGVVVDGKLRLGPIGSAGELGHMIVMPGGRPCGCGSHGCLETLASGPAITSEGVRLLVSGQAPQLFDIVDGDAGRVNPETMGKAARAGDSAVCEAIERAGRYLGIGIANLVVALHPQLIVLGGGVAGLGDLIFEPTRRALADNVRMFPVDDVLIEPSALGNRAGVLGAIALARRGGVVH